MASPLPQVLDTIPEAAGALGAPAEPESRATLIDALRGFALFGVCLGNILTGFAWWTPTEHAPVTSALQLPTDNLAYFLTHAFVDGKFYSIFSLLFGLGFALQLTRRSDEPTALQLYRRRLRILMAIGFVHLALFWIGDILLFYALLGFILLRLRGTEDRRLLRWTVVLLLMPVLFALPKVITPFATLGLPFFLPAEFVARGFGFDLTSPTLITDIFIRGDLLTVMKGNVVGIFFRYGDLLDSGRPFKVLAMFLLGLLIGRHRAWERLDHFAPLLRRVLALGLVIGLPMSLGQAWVAGLPRETTMGGWRVLLDSALYALGVVPLALAYAAAFVLLWRIPGWQGRLAFLAPTGRMALTNYLMQTLIGITLFYGIGFGLGMRLGATWFPLLALLILIVQTLFSQWWLARYRFGPMEWVWRSLTYGRRQPLRRE
ncbi:MAG TPA: DUF418 domain-containing protein [Gemmatimonadales bacterium]|nr:DUF418 domain-containing protein [Gemmatimonadales bacterium]